MQTIRLDASHARFRGPQALEFEFELSSFSELRGKSITEINIVGAHLPFDGWKIPTVEFHFRRKADSVFFVSIPNDSCGAKTYAARVQHCMNSSGNFTEATCRYDEQQKTFELVLNADDQVTLKELRPIKSSPPSALVQLCPKQTAESIRFEVCSTPQAKGEFSLKANVSPNHHDAIGTLVHKLTPSKGEGNFLATRIGPTKRFVKPQPSNEVFVEILLCIDEYVAYFGEDAGWYFDLKVKTAQAQGSNSLVGYTLAAAVVFVGARYFFTS